MSKELNSEFNLRTFCHGLMMGAADAVPGVSGGTIALILGIYSKFINSITICLNFVKERFPYSDKEKFSASFFFLLTIGTGMLISYYVITKLLVASGDELGLLERKETAPFVYSFFFGLVLFSINEPWKFVQHPKVKHYLFFVLGILTIYLYANSSYNSEGNFLLVISGALALTAMLLPGISGALVLLTLGQYTKVASSFHDLDYIILSYFLFGGIIALFSFVPIMNYSMRYHLDSTMSLLTGFMCGSLVTLWPWKVDYEKEGLSANLSISNVFEIYPFLSILLTIMFLILGGFMSYILRNMETKTVI